METKNIYFISGIDTDAGKSYCTAWYARELMQRGLRVITQKFIQTGNTGHSEDIDLHRHLTGTGYLPEDKEGADHARDILLPLLPPPRRPHRQAPDRLRENRACHQGTFPPL